LYRNPGWRLVRRRLTRLTLGFVVKPFQGKFDATTRAPNAKNGNNACDVVAKPGVSQAKNINDVAPLPEIVRDEVAKRW